ncbi:hypothetical protein [Microbacterium invictum]|uniref:Uncharacterized protein n=1 Tax=Microbacterium invictum TaxID=515415 RepID=A0AA40SQA1_9MICO|nr:hypothetical protein [Microbacterium invictum]MBB4140408.1 hypothetical protein [Microbacterium invictum]
MITDFEVHLSAIAELQEMDPGFAQVLSDRLRDDLIRHGVLDVLDEAHRVELARFVRSQPGLSGQRWIEVLLTLGKLNRFNVLSEPIDWGVRLQGAAGDDRPSIADPTFDDTRPKVELCTVRDLSRSSTLQALRDLDADAHLSFGGVRKEFWAQVLEPLAVRSRTVHIVDRFIFRRLDQNSSERDHVLPWLITRLGQLDNNDGIEVTLTSDDAEGFTPEEGLRLLRPWFQSGNLKFIEVVTAPRNDLPHDRHIRFGCGAAILLPAGFDRLARADVRARDGVNWIYRDLRQLGPLRNAEQMALRSKRMRSARATLRE